jgi:hypothetical protein
MGVPLLVMRGRSLVERVALDLRAFLVPLFLIRH